MQTEIIEEFRKGLTEIKDGITKSDKNLTDLNATLKTVQSENERLQSEFTKLQRMYLNRPSSTIHHPSPIPRGMVSDECARYLGSTFVLQCAKSGKLELLSQSAATRDALLNSARQTLGLEVRAALTTTDIPLPIGYSGELRALIAQFGVIRPNMFPYPICMGTSKPPRMGARPQFASIAISGAFAEGSPTITFASLESHKIGGGGRLAPPNGAATIGPLGRIPAAGCGGGGP